MLRIHTKLMSCVWGLVYVICLQKQMKTTKKSLLQINKRRCGVRKLDTCYGRSRHEKRHGIEATNFDKTALSLVGISQV